MKPALLLSLLLLTAYPQRSAAGPAADLARVHAIGVMSALGDRISVRKISATIFGLKASEFDAPADFDALVFDTVKADLSARFNVSAVSAPPEAAALLKPGFWGGPDVGALVRSQPAAGVDAYLVIYPISHRLAYPSNQTVTGLGVYQLSRILYANPPHAFTAYEVDLVQAGTGKTLAHHVGEMREPNFLATPVQEVGTPVDPTLYAETAGEMTQDQKDGLTAVLLPLLQESLHQTLVKMHLNSGAAPVLR